jgi:hypothetical protein
MNDRNSSAPTQALFEFINIQYIEFISTAIYIIASVDL